MADDKILQHSHYKEEPVPRLEEAQLSYPQWLTKMHQIYQGEDPPEVPASLTTSVDAFVNAGRWLWMCVACNSAITAEAGQPSICVECATQGWVNVIFPSNREDVETELLKQPGHRAHAPIRQWHPGWDISVLEDRTARAQAAVDAGEPFPTSLSIGATRVWSVGEILTAANKNTYERTVLEDLAGRNGPVEYEGPIVIDSLTTTERNALTLTGTGGLGASGNGLVIYNSTKAVFERYENGAWREFTNLAELTIASAAQGDLLFFGSGPTLSRLGAGTDRQAARTHGTAANPSWADLEDLRVAASTSQGEIPFIGSNGRLNRLATPSAMGTNLLKSGGANADPSWQAFAGVAILTEYTTAGTHTFNPPAGTHIGLIECVGGGAGGEGGHLDSGTGRGGGRGGGGGSRVVSNAIPGIHRLSNVTVVVGAGGTGGAGDTNTGAVNTAGSGTVGGASSFSTTGNLGYTTAAGGAIRATTEGAIGAAGGTAAAGAGGGGGRDNPTNTANGGAGGGASAPTVAGGNGGTPTVAATNGSSPTGTDGAGGGGGSPSTSAPSNNGGNGGARGGGGGSGIIAGSGSGGAGGNGGPGVVRIWAW